MTSDGVEYLGGAIGSKSFLSTILSRKVCQWCEEIFSLVEIAETKHHAAFAAFTHGISTSWQYFSQITEVTFLLTIEKPFKQFENLIYGKFIPVLTGSKLFDDKTHCLLYLPFKLGVLNLINPAIQLPNHADLNLCQYMLSLDQSIFFCLFKF